MHTVYGCTVFEMQRLHLAWIRYVQCRLYSLYAVNIHAAAADARVRGEAGDRTARCCTAL